MTMTLENGVLKGEKMKFISGVVEGKQSGAFSFVPLGEFIGRPSWTKSGP